MKKNNINITNCLEIGGYSSENTINISDFENGERQDISNEIGDLTLDGLNFSTRDFVSGYVTVSVNHNDITEKSYSKKIIISDKDISGNALFDDWADGKINNRDTFRDTPYSYESLRGGVNSKRKVWEQPNGSLNPNNGNLICELDTNRNISGYCSDISGIDFSKGFKFAVDFTQVSENASNYGASTLDFDFRTDVFDSSRGQIAVKLDLYDGKDSGLVFYNDGDLQSYRNKKLNVSSSSRYKLLIEKDESNKWYFYWDVDNLQNPKSDELLQSFEESIKPSFSEQNSGITMETAHGSWSIKIHRMEIFNT